MIRIEDRIIPSADLGVENPLPDLKGSLSKIFFKNGPNMSEEDRENLNLGFVSTILPYTIQNNYNRELKDKTYQTVVLENKYLKATFIPELGGRLWSLYDKIAQREIFYTNKVFQPANLALRNAWFSGGLEFNCGVRGHNVHTCSPLFTRIAKTKDGQEVLQMYEWERIRGMAYGINAYLPEDSRVLFIRITVENTQGNDTWSYWWSNGAVNETEKTRIIVPTDETFTSLYDHDGTRILDKIPYPEVDGYDASYPFSGPRSRDYFYRIPKDAPERWEASVEPDGKGALQMSTHELLGRKLFLWGTTIGGRNWSEFLGTEGDHYTETQAGKAYTQFEHVPMAANETWEWTEGYTALECDPEKTHGSWEDAKAAVEDYIHNNLGIKDVEGTLRNIVPTEFGSYKLIRHGSGFGALQELADGKRLSAFYDYYPESMNDLQSPWQQLLRQGYMDEPDVTAPVYSYISGEKWIKLLEKSLEKPEGRHWYTYYQLGVAYWTVKEFEKSKAAFRTSADLTPNPWAYYCISNLEEDAGNVDSAIDYMEKAVAFDTGCVNLYIEYAKLLNRSGNHKTLADRFESLPEIAKNRSRIRLELAKAFVKLEEYEKAADIINPSFILPDIQEGETSISNLWFELYLKIVQKTNPELSEAEAIKLRGKLYPLPKHLDFRMEAVPKE